MIVITLKGSLEVAFKNKEKIKAGGRDVKRGVK